MGHALWLARLSILLCLAVLLARLWTRSRTRWDVSRLRVSPTDVSIGRTVYARSGKPKPRVGLRGVHSRMKANILTAP